MKYQNNGELIKINEQTFIWIKLEKEAILNDK